MGHEKNEHGKRELIVCEKPTMAIKLAEALAKQKGVSKEKKSYKKVPYFIVGNSIIVPAVGHLYTITEKVKGKWVYPVFDIAWKECYKVSKELMYTKPYIELIKRLCKECQRIIVATDYDIEGEVIGYNIVRFACGTTNALRMKFSTTTEDELISAYKNVMKTLDMGQAYAGETRHVLDWLWGINLSRALTLAIRHATNKFKILSIGRVQGPSLKILVKREHEIRAFKPVPYWQLELITNKLRLMHVNKRFLDKQEVLEIKRNVEKGVPYVKSLKERTVVHKPVPPFDFTALQIEAYKQFRISPKETSEIAQKLYINSYISYPRTSSNQLPASVGYEKIIEKLGKQKKYGEVCKLLLKKKVLKPANGTKKDPAHPACYPTGEIPKELNEKESKIYDLIVKRTLASFGDDAIRSVTNVVVECSGEEFSASFTYTKVKGWHTIYEPYIKLEEQVMPDIKEKEKLTLKGIELHEKETEPPKRYTTASLIKALEDKGLGTKGTRAEIVDNLIKRNYGKENGNITVTTLGEVTEKTLETYCPAILDEKLTRHFEEKLEEIRAGNIKKEKIIEEAKKVLLNIIVRFKKQELEIGKKLSEAYIKTLDEDSYIGKCECGNDLRKMYSKKTKAYFIGCKGYPKCKNIYWLPKGYGVVATKEVCKLCGMPIVLLIKKGKKPWRLCINNKCKSREY